MTTRVLLSWSSGKDSAWALHVLRQRPDVEIAGLVTTFNEAFQRVAMHGVRAELVRVQATAARLPLWSVPLPWPCPNAAYEERMRGIVERARSEGIHAIAFGDLYLEDIRAYRERQLAGTGLRPLFPLWGTPADTPALARSMIASGLRAILTCVDPKQLDARFVGREFDHALLADLPPHVDPCGERGEFHTFCHAGPMFDFPISISLGGTVERDGFWFADVHSGNPDTAPTLGISTAESHRLVGPSADVARDGGERKASSIAAADEGAPPGDAGNSPVRSNSPSG